MTEPITVNDVIQRLEVVKSHTSKVDQPFERGMTGGIQIALDYLKEVSNG